MMMTLLRSTLANGFVLVDRGGLFNVRQDVFIFPHSVEFQVRQHLTHHLCCSKEDIIDEVIDDLDVQYHWSSIAVELDNDIAQLLLKEIVQLWLNIRSFSAACSFVERFKQCQEKSTQKPVGLRKGLKRKKLDMDKADEK